MEKKYMEKVFYLEACDINPDGSLKSYVGNGDQVIVMGLANYCGYCTKAKPDFENFAKQSNNTICCAILSDGDPTEKQASNFFKMWDENHRGVPTYIGFDKNGKFKSIHTGGRDVKSLLEFSNTL